MYTRFAADKAVVPSDSWNDETIRHQVVCPVCGFNCTHPEGVRTVSGNDEYAASWPGRGDLTVLSFEGECGHHWELCFGFHKGEVFVFSRVLSPEAP